MSDQKMHFLSWMWHIFHSQKTVDIWCKYDTHERITNSSPIATGSSQASRQVVPPRLEVFWRKVLRAISSCEAPPRYVQSCEAQQGMYNLTKSTAWEFWPKVLHEILSWEIPQTAIYCKLEVIRLKTLEGASWFPFRLLRPDQPAGYHYLSKYMTMIKENIKVFSSYDEKGLALCISEIS